MAKEIQFSLVYRDMWQSSGKYVPTKAQLEQVAPAIIDMGCFSRVETNGGGFEQVNLLFGENPNPSVRAWTNPFNKAGILTHMLERGLNGIRLSPVAADIRRLMFKVKGKQGTNISRSFCGLNDPRNIIDSVKYAKEGKMIAQATLSITHSKIHTIEYYVKLAEQLIEGGADEICLKDMAGVGRPATLGKIVKQIKKKHPKIVIQYHAHTTPGFAPASILEVAYAGADIIDVGMEPLAWGTGHVDILTAQNMLKDAGFKVSEVNLKAYMEVRKLTQEFMDDFLGYYMDPQNRMETALLIGSGLPGGMMGSLMADLGNNLKSLNSWLKKKNKPLLTKNELLIKLFQEVEYIWPKMGYPPLVTPYSQYVKNVALMNVIQLIKGKNRFSLIDDNTWDMLLGKAGKLPAEIDPELKKLAEEQGKEIFTGSPQDLYPDELDVFKKEMDKNGWEYGQDGEELFELAMHPQQYRNYRSGEAKKQFEKDLAKKKTQKEQKEQKNAESSNIVLPQTLVVDVSGEKFSVTVSAENTTTTSQQPTPQAKPISTPSSDNTREVVAPLEGTFYRTKVPSDKAIQVGDTVQKGAIIGYIESMKVYNAIISAQSGKITEICISDGGKVEEDDVLIRVL